MSETWLYWVGCAASYDQRNQKVALAFVKLLKEAAVPFVILGNVERCCGDPARRLGNEYLYQSLVEHNKAAIEATGCSHIVTACPHCYRVLKHEYGFTRQEVVHHSELLARLIADGRLTAEAKASKCGRTAYHDSCYLGRYEGVYEQPRSVLKTVTGLQLVELPRHREQSFCCGGGGGRVFLEEPEGQRINHLRTDEAIETAVSTVVTACPFCMTMLSDGAKDRDDAFTVLDLAEVLIR